MALAHHGLAAFGELDDAASAVVSVWDSLRHVLAFQSVHERCRGAAGQAEVTGQRGLTAVAVDGEVGQCLAFRGAQVDGLGYDLAVVLAGQDDPAEVMDRFGDDRALLVDGCSSCRGV